VRRLVACSLLLTSCVVVADGADRVWERPTGIPSGGVAAAVLADLDADGLPDVLVASMSRDGPQACVALKGPTGERMWRRVRPGQAVVRTGDLDGRPGDEVVVSRLDSLEILDGRTGVRTAGVRLPGESGGLEMGDLDGDRVPDLVSSCGDERNDTLIAFSGEDLRVLWKLAAAPGEGRLARGFGGATICDVDGDGRGETFVIENTDRLAAVASNGARLWSVPLGERAGPLPRGAATSLPLVGDLTGDGEREVAVGCLAGALVVADCATGQVIARRTFGIEAHQALTGRRKIPRFLREIIAESGEPVNEIAAIAFDGRPGRTLAFGCSDGRVYAVSARSYEVLWSFDTSGQVYDRPIALDVTGDGLPDVVAWDAEAVYAVDGVTGAGTRWIPAPGGVSGVLVGDVDGDGGADVVLVGRSGSEVSLWSTGIPWRGPSSAGGSPR
jgi:hypothetical protein